MLLLVLKKLNITAQTGINVKLMFSKFLDLRFYACQLKLCHGYRSKAGKAINRQTKFWKTISDQYNISLRKKRLLFKPYHSVVI